MSGRWQFGRYNYQVEAPAKPVGPGLAFVRKVGLARSDVAGWTLFDEESLV